MGALCGVIPLIKSTWPYPSAVELQLTPLNSIGFVGKIKHYTHSNPPVINWANRIPTDVWITMFAESNTFNELTNPWKCWTIKKFTSELPPNITNDTEIDFCQSSRVRVSRPIFLKQYPGPFDCPSSGARYLRVSERASVTVATIWRSVADYYPNYCNDQTYLLLIWTSYLSHKSAGWRSVALVWHIYTALPRNLNKAVMV